MKLTSQSENIFFLQQELIITCAKIERKKKNAVNKGQMIMPSGIE